MNVFEGARRLSYCVCGLAIITAFVFAIKFEPSVSIDYVITNPNGKFLKTENECPNESGRAFFSKKSKSGGSVYIDICMLTYDFGEGNKLVPYKIDEENMLWGAEWYSDEISNYEKELEVNFKLPEEDEAWVENELARLYWSNWYQTLKYLGVFLFVYLIFVWIVGWVVRGFMGIPQGSDSKQK